MLYGVAFAFAVALGQKFKLYDDNGANTGNAKGSTNLGPGPLWPRTISLLVSLCSLGGLLSECVPFIMLLSLPLIGYFVFATNCARKEDCNEVHPYLTIVPVSY